MVAGMTKHLEILSPQEFPLVAPGDNLLQMLLDSLEREDIVLRNHDVLVLAQKIVSQSENCYVNLRDIKPSSEAALLAVKCDKDPRLVQLILDESEQVLRCVPGVIIVRHRLGLVMANAGIDQSNLPATGADPCVLLLPRNPDFSAGQLKKGLEHATGLELGVIINDSFGRPWRMGTTVVCIGCAGIASPVDQRGEADLFGREMMVTQVALGDEIATAASLLMGQADEARPVVVVRGLEFPRKPESATHLQRPVEQDLFQ